MPWLPRLASLWRNLVRHRRVEAELDAEVESYIALLAEEKGRAGLSPAGAWRAARREVGSVDGLKENVRAVRTGAWIGILVQDLRFGVRILARTPVLSFAAVLALALGIGANTVVFSVINAVLLRPLPFPEPQQLVALAETRPTTGPDDVAPPNFLDWRQAQTAFVDVAAFTPVRVNLTGVPSPETLEGLRASAALFPILGIEPALGSTYGPDTDLSGGGRQVVLSDELWRSRFGADSAIVGRTLTLDDQPFTVVGVMPAEFRFPVETPAQLWVPIAFTDDDVSGRGSHYLGAVARMKPGVRYGQAQATMDVIARRMAATYPATNTDAGITVLPLKDVVVGTSGTPVVLLWGAVAFVLLIATANVASMLLARAAAREREMATRIALGASARRVMAQLLTESVLLAGFGGATGLLLAIWGVRAVRALNPGNVARLGDASIDPAVLAFTVVVSVGTGILFGLAPALAVRRANVIQGLPQGGRSTGSRGTRYYHATLVVNQVALAMIVLVGAGLMLGSLRNLLQTNPGFESNGVLSLRINPSRTSYADLTSRAVFFDKVQTAVAAVPGVEATGAITFLPMTFTGGSLGITVEGAPPRAPGEWEGAVFRVVTSDYFATMRIRIRQGRGFRTADDANAPPVTIVTRALAERHWPGHAAVGRRLKLGGASSTAPWLTVVGVVDDVREFTLRRAAVPELFVPVAQPHPAWTAPHAIVARTDGDPAALAAGIQAALWSVDPDLPVSDVRPLRDVVGATAAETRFYAVVLGLLGATALSLAAVGIYAVMAHGVSQRAREFGLRLALGAHPSTIVASVMRRGVALAALGVGIGMGGAVAVTRFLNAQLYGLTATDPATLFRGGAVLLMAAFVACGLPAWRAARLDPAQSLRHD